MIDCVHWSRLGNEPSHGCCARNLFGGRPSLGVCRHVCAQRAPRAGAAPAAPTPMPSVDVMQGRGPQLWAELHRWALTADLSAARRWLDHFGSRLPCGDCRRKWLDGMNTFPPPLASHDQLFEWTVALHNRVNRHLNKPEVSLDQAIIIWSPAASASATWRKNRRRSPEAPQPLQLPADEPPDPAGDLSRYFDAVWCINLDADADRWQEFSRRLAGCAWPFGPVGRFPAIHGDTVGVPDHYHQGGGAWGCLQSHLRVLEASLMAGHKRILVMEDDVDLRPGFGPAAAAFLIALDRQPWDCLMFGGQHMTSPAPFKSGVVRATNTQRTHCMAFNRSFMRELYRYWSGPLDEHCDWSLGPFAARFRTFAPERFIVGQRGGRSWITGSQKPAEWWNPPRPDAPVVWLRCPRPVLESCRDLFHAGNRRNADGVCVGLADVFDPAKNPTERQQIAALKNWISMIQWEVESLRGPFASLSDGPVCTIWHPGACRELSRTVRAATANVLLEIDVTTEQEARQALIDRAAVVTAA
jgi:hypothetical protein